MDENKAEKSEQGAACNHTKTSAGTWGDQNVITCSDCGRMWGDIPWRRWFDDPENEPKIEKLARSLFENAEVSAVIWLLFGLVSRRSEQLIDEKDMTYEQCALVLACVATMVRSVALEMESKDALGFLEYGATKFAETVREGVRKGQLLP